MNLKGDHVPEPRVLLPYKKGPIPVYPMISILPLPDMASHQKCQLKRLLLIQAGIAIRRIIQT